MEGERNMKKTLYTLCAATMVASFALVPEAKAQVEEFDATPILEAGEEQPFKYFSATGKISNISEKEAGNFATIDSEENPFGFYFNEETLILDNSGKITELKEGLTITAFIDGSKPMLMIYPPQYSPDVVIVQTGNPGTVQLDQFDSNYLNKVQDLIIRLDDQSEIVNLSGRELTKEEIVEKEVLIFYDIVLESYPAQTGPSKVIVLERDEEIPVVELTDIEKAYQIAENDHYVVNGVKMIPLRLVAEQLGYQVDSTGIGAIVHKGAVSFTITRGTTDYGYNKSIRQFEEAPALLEPRKTYVPFTFIEELVKHY